MSEMFARIGLRSAIVILSAVLTVLVLAVAILPSASVADDSHPMQVKGYVYDDHGNKIANADVTVTMYNGLVAGVSKTATSSSSPKGFFSVNFALGEWATGNTIQVVAQYQSGTQGLNDTVTANGVNFFQWENVTLPYEIPQFGNNTTGLLLTAGLIGVVAVVALVWRRSAK
jgi:hypothetical protein